MTALTPEDPRHGTNAGYVAGCRETCCAVARRRYQKGHRVLLHRGTRTRYTRAEVETIIAPWVHMGITHNAITQAAGIGSDLGRVGKGTVLPDTVAALAALTEDSFHDRVFVLSDLTRRRIYSLMAAGHPLASIPIGSGGLWRYRERLWARTARAIRDHYAAVEFTMGPSAHTRALALNRGHQPPLAWDDPGTLAWPLNTPDEETAA